MVSLTSDRNVWEKTWADERCCATCALCFTTSVGTRTKHATYKQEHQSHKYDELNMIWKQHNLLPSDELIITVTHVLVYSGCALVRTTTTLSCNRTHVPVIQIRFPHELDLSYIPVYVSVLWNQVVFFWSSDDCHHWLVSCFKPNWFNWFGLIWCFFGAWNSYIW